MSKHYALSCIGLVYVHIWVWVCMIGYCGCGYIYVLLGVVIDKREIRERDKI